MYTYFKNLKKLFPNIFIIQIFVTIAPNSCSNDIPLNLWDVLFVQNELFPKISLNDSSNINPFHINPGPLSRTERNPEWQGEKAFAHFLNQCHEIIRMQQTASKRMYKKLQVNPQFKLCQLKPAILKIIAQGIKHGVAECKYQFQYRRWDCPTFLINDSLFGKILNHGIKEKAFVYGIMSSAILYNTVRSCRRGQILSQGSCGCLNSGSRHFTQPLDAGDVTFKLRLPSFGDSKKYGDYFNSDKSEEAPKFSFITRKKVLSWRRNNNNKSDTRAANIIFNNKNLLTQMGNSSRYESRIVWNDGKYALAQSSFSKVPIRSAKISRNRFRRTLNQEKVTWDWGGCSDDLAYGQKISKLVLTIFERLKDPESIMNAHNLRTGRKVTKSASKTVCKCHGISGSCSSQICWKKLPSFRIISDRLLVKFDGAIKVKISSLKSIPAKTGKESFIGAYNFSYNRSVSYQKMLKRDSITDPYYLERRSNPQESDSSEKNLKEKFFWMTPTKRHLIYLEESPDFCSYNLTTGSMGTKNRVCDPSSQGLNGCDMLCCGRGYESEKETKIARDCKCSFKWCCRVECQACITPNIKHYCS